MNPRHLAPAVVATLCALLLPATAPAAPGPAADPPAGRTADSGPFVERDDDLAHPFTERRGQRRDAAVQAITEDPGLTARTVPAGETGAAEIRPPAQARVFVILVEFGDRPNTSGGPGSGSRPGEANPACPAHEGNQPGRHMRPSSPAGA
ncbi:hypothetical protein [Embleya sp. NPDC005971]|uniref:hypothetical protein n=1 Tax=Embleya sp. NPDC005971 TaxID=3156724 RepID=UPI0033F47831